MSDESPATPPSKAAHKPPPPVPAPGAPALHRVCIQCNNMFRVPPEYFDAKQCPNCHKG
ncbi:MAG: hypothetical protein LAN71_10905 [Acidobacteriia bacterium]|nr:hypothetical protein [Terriglobia bacterium]